ncbi:MAG: acyl-CoA dehydrogenase family protein [Proteobacteria bacterium]|nr:acyl-CoA dehydrogenase family protein [Pseudomonadota bacterium]MBU4471261.1 acyl-CoA dehydrogenase family protein [Pseudomonadota bacterium]MCG2751711.1 acyl-CoA dehydrogenase family protein [Desulfobacteraceae bacterium]
MMRRELGRKLGKKGWLYPQYPVAYGGGGLASEYSTVINRELAEIELSNPPIYDSGRLAAPTIIAQGTDAQKKRMLPPILKGEAVTWQLFTEPAAGTDEANQQIDARRSEHEKEYFIVNGGKIFVGGLYSPPDQFLLLTRSDPDAPRHRNLAMFIAPADLPGIQILPLDLFPPGTFGQTCYESGDGAPGVKHSVFFDNVKIHESFLIGGEGDGWQVANATLTVEHGGGGSSAEDREKEAQPAGGPASKYEATPAKGKTAGGGIGGPEKSKEPPGAYIPKNMVVHRFLQECTTNPNIRKRLEDNPHLLQTVVDIFIGDQIERLLNTRNTDAGRRGVRAHYMGPQHSLYLKMFGTELGAKMTKVLGPFALTDDDTWGMADDLFEVSQRSGVCVAPGGTPEALKIIISRALRIGR